MAQTTPSTKKLCGIKVHDLSLPNSLTKQGHCRQCHNLGNRAYRRSARGREIKKIENNKVQTNYYKYKNKLKHKIEQKKQQIAELERILQDAAEVGHRNGATEDT